MAGQVTKEALLTLTVDGTKAAATLAQYKQQLNDAKAALEEMNKSGKATNAEIAAQEQVIKSIQKEMNSYQNQVQKAIQADKNEEGSLKSLRGQLSNLRSEYDALSRTEREGAKGQEMQKKISILHNELMNAEASTGRWQRNVGNYAKSIIAAFGGVGGAISGLKAPIDVASLGLKGMSKIPIVAILGALLKVVNSLISAFKRNEAALQSLSAAFSPFKAIGTSVQRIFDAMVGAIVKAVDWLSKLADKLGLIRGLAKEQQQITKDEIRLVKMRREIEVQNAKDELETSKLRSQAEEKNKYSAQERLKFLEEADAREKAIAERNLQYAQLNYDVLKRKSELTANDAETNDQLAEAEANLYNVQRSYYDKMRELKSKLVTTNNEATAATKQEAEAEVKVTEEVTKQIEERIKIKQQEIETRLRLVQKGTEDELNLQLELLTIKHQREMDALAQQEGTNELRLLKEQEFEMEMQTLKDNYWAQEDARIAAEVDNIIAEMTREEEAHKAKEDAKRKSTAAAATAIGGAMASIGELAEEIAGDNKAIAKMSKVLAIAQIAINTGVATANGIKEAMATPFPANIAAIATTIAAITSGMASAIASVKSAKFASGGLVQGPGTGTSDSIPAALSAGESVMTAKTTSLFAPLLSAMNQIGGGRAIPTPPSSDGVGMIEQAIARGMQAAQLSVSVTEIDKVRDNMTRIQNIATF